MSLSVKISRSRGLQSTEKKIAKELEKSLKPRILKAASRVMRNNILQDPQVFVDKAIEILNTMQSIYYGGGGIGDEDPADFDNIGLMEVEVLNNLNKTLKVEVVGDVLRWEAVVVSEEFVGFGGNSIVGRPADRGDPNTLPWIAFFLAGSIEEELLWISDDTAIKIEVATGKAFSHLGRFRKGFLIRRTKGIDGMLKAAGIRNPASLIHPISGKPGRSYFANLQEDITNDPRFMQLYVVPAIEQASRLITSAK